MYAASLTLSVRNVASGSGVAGEGYLLVRERVSWPPASRYSPSNRPIIGSSRSANTDTSEQKICAAELAVGDTQMALLGKVFVELCQRQFHALCMVAFWNSVGNVFRRDLDASTAISRRNLPAHDHRVVVGRIVRDEVHGPYDPGVRNEVHKSGLHDIRVRSRLALRR